LREPRADIKQDSLSMRLPAQEYGMIPPNGRLMPFEQPAPTRHASCVSDRGLRSENAVRESQRELSSIVDNIPGFVWCASTDGQLIYINNRLSEYVGAPVESLWGQGWLDSVHPQDRKAALDTWKRCVATGAPMENQYRLRRADGVYRWFHVPRQLVHTSDGQPTLWYGLLVDIEERKRAEQALAVQNARLQLLLNLTNQITRNQSEGRLQRENVALREEIDKASMFEEIVGTSPALQAVLSRISRVAPIDSTVLITGETGTGKELVARAVHRRSPRVSRPFVSVNCAAIPRDLVASELFGHERGAFTGATQQRLGRFELANGGTIFLDEVGELPPATQMALLRVLQEREFERVGGTRSIRAEVRVIAATNRDLQAAIRAGSFRSDLFYRLHVFPIEVPPLRERKEDIALLADYFIDRYARKAGKRIQGISKRTLHLLQSYTWPGNVRELQNVIERSVILCDTEIFSIDESWLPQQSFLMESKHEAEVNRLRLQEKRVIEAALQESRGRVFGPSGAAARLGIARSTLESKIRSLKIDKNRFRS
jgi:PAS domain S-box-containing protein